MNRSFVAGAIVSAVVIAAAASGFALGELRVAKSNQPANSLHPADFDPEYRVLSKYADAASLVQAYNYWDERCRGPEGGSDDATARMVCGKREAVADKLWKAGYCSGLRSQVNADLSMAERDMSWHPCGPDSCRQGDPC